MPLFSKAKMAALSPTSPPKGFKAPNKNPKKFPPKGNTKAPSGFLSSFGKK